MAVLDQIGTTDPVKQGTKLTWSYFDGEREGVQYKGERSIIYSLYQSYKTVAGFNPEYDGIDYDPGKGLATLTLYKVADGEPLYELSANEISQSITMHEYFEDLTVEQVRQVLVVINDLTPADGTWTDLQQQLHTQLLFGITEYNISQYVLRETKTVSKRSTVTAAFDEVNTVSDPPSTSAANTLIGELPTGEWVKKSPVVRQIGSRKWQIITEWWWYRKASRILYGGTYL
jgi:hypothetical protein